MSDNYWLSLQNISKYESQNYRNHFFMNTANVGAKCIVPKPLNKSGLEKSGFIEFKKKS